MSRIAPLSIVHQSFPAAVPYVLLVDDHEPSLRRLAEVIGRAGHRCIASISGTEAVRCCDRSRPRVVVTDFGMPNLNGCKLAGWLQARHPSVPIILLSGETFDPRSRLEMDRIFTAVLKKPVDLERLLGLIDRLMPPVPNSNQDARRS